MSKSTIPSRTLVHRLLVDESTMGMVIAGALPHGGYQVDKIYVKGEKYVRDAEWLGYEKAFHEWKEKRRLQEYELERVGITDYASNPVWESLNKKVLAAYRKREDRAFELRNQ